MHFCVYKARLEKKSNAKLRGLASAAARDSMQPGRGITQPKLILILSHPFTPIDLEVEHPISFKDPLRALPV